MQFDRLRRRAFITLLGGAAAWPLAARAQQTPEVPRVGFVYSGSKAAAAPRIEAILSGLRGSGYAAPAQVEIVARTAEGDPAQIAPLVAEVIAKNVNVIIVNGPSVLHAAHLATSTIPIVALDLETDPVAGGVAASLARPGGNITGVFLPIASICVPCAPGSPLTVSSPLKACLVPAMPTVGRYLSRSGTPNGDCGIVFERKCESRRISPWHRRDKLRSVAMCWAQVCLPSRFHRRPAKASARGPLVLRPP